MNGLEGFLYPNEIETQWSILIVIYPFITGLVAGAFIVSSLYHVFGIQNLKAFSRFSLLTALSFLLVAPLPLQVHLGRPERAFEIFFTPNFRSAMAGFGYIWLSYLILVAFETWLVFRPDIIRLAKANSGLRGTIYRALALGVLDHSEEEFKRDEKIVKALALIGIPWASLLHGYVGFIFGGVKANPWWSSSLMPVIFLLSAVVSGIALLIVLYVVARTLTRKPLEHEAIGALAKWLLGFMILDLAIEGLELLNMAYEGEESWEAISVLITQKIAFSYLGIQIGLGSLIPLVILGAVALMGNRARTQLSFLAASLVLVGVFAMRWNVVIGGQLFSKSLLGFKSYVPPLLGQEGLLVAAGLLMLPLVIFAVLSSQLSPWTEEQPVAQPEEERARYRERVYAMGIGSNPRR
ncbi:MAG: polysulfide reductase NrfD [Chloroflexi bacterium]|nr:polysulfide reductase NrfD [Chloroflexota bacterium]